jgi:hypothetical protein
MNRRFRLLPLLVLAATTLACVAMPLGAPAPPRYRLQAVGPLPIVATSSTGAAAGFPVSRMADGNVNTEWLSAGFRPASVAATADLGTTASLASIAIKTGPMPTGTSFDVQASATGAAFATVLAGQRNTTWNLEPKALPAGATGRFVRILWHNRAASPVNNFSIFELVVNGQAAGPTPTPAPTATPTPAPTPTATPVPPGAAIVVQPDTVLHPTTGHVLGPVRNHVATNFGNAAAQLAKLRELIPTWGPDSFLYRIGHGPTDGRTDFPTYTGFHFEATWGLAGPYPYDDLRNYLAEAQQMGADQFHVINFGTSDAAEAARYVSFLDHAGDANRAAHPSPNLQPARLFELGNEMSYEKERGHAQFAPNEVAYATRARQFALAMRAAADVPIQIGADATTNSSWTGAGWTGGAAGVRNILATMGDQVDFLTFHGYPSWPVTTFGSVNLPQIMAQNEWNRNKLVTEIKPAIAQAAGGRDVWIANTEFMTGLYSDPTRARGMFGALYAADSLALAFNQDIRLVQLLGLDHDELADDSFFFANDPNRPTPIFKLERLVARHWGDQVVASSTSAVPTVTVQGVATTVVVPRLAVAAAKRGGQTWILVVNRFNDADVVARVDLGGATGPVTAFELSAATGWDAADADEVAIANPDLAAYRFKRASVTLFELGSP